MCSVAMTAILTRKTTVEYCAARGIYVCNENTLLAMLTGD